jgi:hypothetical protein
MRIDTSAGVLQWPPTIHQRWCGNSIKRATRRSISQIGFMPLMSKKKQPFIIDEDLNETFQRQTFTFRHQNSSSRCQTIF